MGPLQRRQRWCQAILLASVAGLMVAAVGTKRCRAAAPADRLLPQQTVFYVSIHDYEQFKARFNQTGYGRILADPTMEAFMADVNAAIAEMSADVEAQIGMSLSALLALPQGETAVGLTFGDQRWGLVALIEVGENEPKVRELLELASKKVEEAGSTRREEEIDGTTVILFDPPAEDPNPVQAAYFIREARLGLLLGSVDQMAALAGDLLSRWDGEGQGTLADNPAYQDILQHSAPEEGDQALLDWYLDPMGLLTQMSKVAPQAGMEMVLAFLPQLGLDQVKGIGGSFDMAVGPYDSVSRMFIAVEPPIGGALNLLSWPNANLAPEGWVPAEVASYTTISWDLKLLWKTVGELYDQFLGPGQFAVMAQGMGQQFGIDVQQDVVNPLGSRMTLVADYEEPVTPMSTRTLYGVALDDAERFSQTLDKLIGLVGQGQVQQREFQGHVIYEMEIPAGAMMPLGGVGGGGFGQPAGKPRKMGVTVAHDYLLVADNVNLLDRVLREGEDRLADSLDYQLVAERFPEQTNMLSFSRPEMNLRPWYEMCRSGQLTGMMGMMQLPEALKRIDGTKLPPFDELARYLSPGGGYGTVEEGGTLFVSYWLRKESP